MSTVITFDTLSVGDSVGDQFAKVNGITFTSPHGVIDWDPYSPFGNVLVAAKAGGPVEFPTWSITGTLASPTHSRFAVTANEGVAVTFKDKNGAVITDYAIRPPKFYNNGAYFLGEFATGKANIASFNIHFINSGPFSLASINFDTAGPHKPDFRLMFSSANVPEKAGQTGSINVKIARLYGSNGPIHLEVSSTPPGIFKPSQITTLVQDGKVVPLPLIAMSAIQQDNIIRVTGKPLAESAGSGHRIMDYPYFPPIELPPP